VSCAVAKAWMPRDPTSTADALLTDGRLFRFTLGRPQDRPHDRPHDRLREAANPRPTLGTGHDELDARLPGGGWPAAALIEVLVDKSGLGEVQLFLPAMALRQQTAVGETPWLVWIAPPYEPYAPALVQAGIDLKHLLIVRPASAMEGLWAAEEALRSGACAAVLLWLRGADNRWLRRLKLAAESGGALGILFRPERHRCESSPANLRLLLTRDAERRQLEILKVQGGRPGPVAGWHR
jgi:hypothetical protein